MNQEQRHTIITDPSYMYTMLKCLRGVHIPTGRGVVDPFVGVAVTGAAAVVTLLLLPGGRKNDSHQLCEYNSFRQT